MPPTTVPIVRFALAWFVLLGGLVGWWLCRPSFDTSAWIDGATAVLFLSSKVATLVCMPPDDRRRLGRGRFVAYLFWPGMQPRQFLPERAPADVRPAPTVVGVLVNAVTGAAFLWAFPALMPQDWQTPKFLSSLAGYAFLLLFAIFDAWALAYRACGVGVEKLWHCPVAATSLNDFWGHRWNRVFSGMLREVLFAPLARRIGATAALFAVFAYSGLLHENFSVAVGGFGRPFLYFALQGVAAWAERRQGVRRVLKGRPILGWLWTAAVVVGPSPLLFTERFRTDYLLPKMVELGVPGLVAIPP